MSSSCKSRLGLRIKFQTDNDIFQGQVESQQMMLADRKKEINAGYF
jgi:hypothetical protein